MQPPLATRIFRQRFEATQARGQALGEVILSAGKSRIMEGSEQLVSELRGQCSTRVTHALHWKLLPGVAKLLLPCFTVNEVFSASLTPLNCCKPGCDRKCRWFLIWLLLR